MRMGWRLSLGALVLVGAGLLLARTVFRPPAVDVETALVGWGPVEDVVANSEAGSVRSRTFARLGAERAGRVAAIPVREGGVVRRGQRLLVLDTSSAHARLEVAVREQQAAHALHEVAHAAAARARQQYDRTVSLHARSLASQEELEAATARRQATDSELAAAEARLASAASAVRVARDEVAHHDVRAPFDGVVTHRYVEVGESVVPGQMVLDLVDPSRQYVSAPIDERDAGRLRGGLPARVTVDAFPGESWPAVVSRVGDVVDETEDQNRTVEVDVELEDGPRTRRLRPGMTADVEIVLERRERVLRVPSVAVIEGQRVLVSERGRAVTRAVRVGLHNWQWSEIVFGLESGQSVIVTLDRAGLRDGVSISPRPAAEEVVSEAADSSAGVSLR